MPRILLITRNLPPLVGGMERLNWHMAEELAKVADVRIIGPAGSAALAPSCITVREAPLTPLWKFLLSARRLACREARQWQPDVVLAGSGLTAPLAAAVARTCGARTATYVHGLDVAMRHPAYRAFWLPAIRRMDRIIANSHATADLCRQVGVDADRVGIVHPGVDLPAVAAGESGIQMEGFRQRHQLGDRPLLLSVGRLSVRKGLREFVARSLPRIVAARPDVMLLVVGDAPHQALHAKVQTSSSIQAAADAAGVGEHIRFLGVITDYAELGAVYRAADVHVFPVRDIPGDPEGFGMVAVEAAAHGLPTVAFATGGVVDAVDENRSGQLAVSGDYAAFANATVKMLTESRALRPDCEAFSRQFAWPAFGKRVIAQLGLSVRSGKNRNACATASNECHDSQRQPHAALDMPSRHRKGMKIERLLKLREHAQPMRMLEIGTGSGGIAHYFATHPQLQCDVDAVDVVDNRQVTDGYRYRQVEGTRLPFEDASFDVVLSNHVIEHVGGAGAQHHHLTEIHRVMKPDGVGYLAVPNRWMLTEPHYRLKLLSWWPHAWRTPYLRLMRKGSFYDCEPLQMRQLECMLETAGFTCRNLCIEAWRATFDIERPNARGTRLLQRMPDVLLKRVRRIIPTLIYQITHR